MPHCFGTAIDDDADDMKLATRDQKRCHEVSADTLEFAFDEPNASVNIRSLHFIEEA